MRVAVGSATMFSQTIVFLRPICSKIARKLTCATTLATNTSTQIFELTVLKATTSGENFHNTDQ